MKLVRLLMLSGMLAVMFAGTAAADPIQINFQLDGVTTVGGILPATTAYVFPLPPAENEGLPILGTGWIDFDLGTGFVALENYNMILDVDVPPDDALIEIRGWRQNITSIDEDGNLTSTAQGTSTCTIILGGGWGPLVCPNMSPTILPWPPEDPPEGPGSSAVIDISEGTITVIDNSTFALAGTITQYYSYTVVPEPATALLMGAGLLGLGVFARRQRA